MQIIYYFYRLIRKLIKNMTLDYFKRIIILITITIVKFLLVTLFFTIIFNMVFAMVLDPTQ